MSVSIMSRTTAFCWIIVAMIGEITTKPNFGPYDLIFSRMQTCEDVGTGQIHVENKIRYLGGGVHVCNTSASLQLPLDEHFKMKNEIQKRTSQGLWQKVYTWTPKGCKEISSVLGSYFEAFFKAAGKEVKDCPFPAGNFKMINWVVELKFDIFPTMFYNKFRAISTFSYKGVKTGCVISEYEVVPKENTSKKHRQP